MKERLLQLAVLDASALHQAARDCSRRLAQARWELAACLLALERAGLHTANGCSSVAHYAARYLEVDAYLAVELLRVARALEWLPALSAAFRDGLVSWSKVREATRVAETSNDEDWVVFCRAHTVEQIQRHMVRSPRAWDRWGDARPDVSRPASASTDDAAQGMNTERPSSESGKDEAVDSEEPHDSPKTQTEHARGSVPSPTPQQRPAPAVPARIGLKFRLTPEQFGMFRAVENSIRASRPGRMRREEVLEEMCRRLATGSTRRSRLPSQVVVHVDSATGQGWVETERGPRAVTAEVVEESLRTGPVVVVTDRDEARVGPDSQTVAANSASRFEKTSGESNVGTRACKPAPSGDREESKADGQTLSTPAPQDGPSIGEASHRRQQEAQGARQKPTSRPRRPGTPTRRPAIPVALLRALHARSLGRCEMSECSRTGPLHVHHRSPWSTTRTHDVDELMLICSACHALLHKKDFDERRTWRTARDEAIKRRRGKSGRAEQPSFCADAGPSQDDVEFQVAHAEG